VLCFSEERYAALVRKVMFQLQRAVATGIYGDNYEYNSLWDEFCHEMQNGPHEWPEGAWKATIDPFIQVVVDAVPRHEAVLLTIGAIWNLDEDIEVDADAPFPAVICRNLEQEVVKAARARDISRFRLLRSTWE
jgi:hypothetical protein